MDLINENLTFRQYLSANYLQTLLVMPGNRNWDLSPATLAETAVAYADALITELEKAPQ